MKKVISFGALLVGICLIVGCSQSATNTNKLQYRLFKEKINEAVPGHPDALSTAAEAKFANRAYPGIDVPANAHDIARATFKAAAGNSASSGIWELVGPTKARYPGLLTYTGKDYIASGRITALAIAPTCTANSCRLWVAAAGGGVWRTDNAINGSPQWKNVSDSFDSNAIGTLTLDPNDPTGNTIYAGTGEPNASGDSEAGVGVYKSTDGGNTWSLLTATKPLMNGRAVSSIAIRPGDSNTIYVASARAIRGVTAVSGGAVSNNATFAAFGLWKSTDGGVNWSYIWNGNGSVRGVTNVELDPADPDTVYASAFQAGIWRSSVRLDGSPTFQRVFYSSNPATNVDRTTFALTTKNNHTRIYAGNGNTGGPASAVWRTDNADLPAAALATGGANIGWIALTSNDQADPRYATYNFCTGQCWYDIGISTPRGYPDMVYVYGSFQYGEYWRISNSRGILLSTTAGDADPNNNNRTFTDVSWAATPNLQPDGVHPDQHALVVSPTDPNVFFEGSDGGLIHSDGIWDDQSSSCNSRGLAEPRLTTCKRLLSRVPHSLANMNEGLPTLQFQSLSISNQKPLQLVLGGTQDNGTFDYNGSATLWSQAINGDGGQSGFDAVDDKTRFHTYYGPYVDVNHNNANPKGWTWVSDPFSVYPENWNFYVPIISDPVVSGSMFLGEQHIWRTRDSGGDAAFLSTWCSETSPAPAGPPPALCGDWEPLGGAYGSQTGDLISPLYGDRSGTAVFSYVAAVARSSGNSGTMWAATNTGRLFISRNADAVPASNVTYFRLDSSTTPGRFVSGIVVDPTNPNHAWVSYTGYNLATPITVGHVFEVTVNATTNVATFTNLAVEGASGDLPINGIARDDNTGDLYVATDFGVLRRDSTSGTWGGAGSGLPIVEVAGLTINSQARVLYAATHGRAAWRIRLP